LNKALKGNFKAKIMILMIIFVAVPILVSGYITKMIAENNLLKEKEQKLFGITEILDRHLNQDFTATLKEKGALNASKKEKIKVLNEALSIYTDEIAKSYPGIGVGYYVKDLQAIVTYGPSSKFGNMVGKDISAGHPGRKVMKTGEKHLEIGKQVRGQIMNAMLPIKRHGEVIGYVWANELFSDVDRQLSQMDQIIFICLALGTICVILLLLNFWNRLLGDINLVLRGLQKMKFNLRERISGVKGEIGEIADAVNGMAVSILHARSLSENVMDSMIDGVITVDVSGNITFMNQAAMNLTGVHLQEVIGKPYMETMFNEMCFKSILMETLETGANYIGVEMEFPVQGRKNFFISSSTSPLCDSDGNFIGAVLSFKDITERKLLEQQIYRADRLAAIGEMMAGVAHEVRNPLTAIKSLVQYLQEGSTEAERQEYYPVIVKEVDRVNKIIEELLYFSRPSNANVVLTDINWLIEQTIILTKNITKNTVKYDLRMEKELSNVEIDPEQFKQVFLNILINSIQAMGKSGVITIESLMDLKQENILLHFSDTGSGIQEGDLEKVFDPFYTSKKEGTGLGLSVVQRIVAAHHGGVYLQNIPSGGLKVTIQIPISYSRGDEQR
jgi:two-component system sensor histidine kinase AtoS